MTSREAGSSGSSARGADAPGGPADAADRPSADAPDRPSAAAPDRPSADAPPAAPDRPSADAPAAAVGAGGAAQRPLDDADYERLLAFRVALRGFLRHSERIADERGLTPAVHQLLLAIRGGGPSPGPTIAAVAATLDVRHHTAVALAKRAEQLGLLRRTRGAHDHREVHLSLSADGVASLDAITRQNLPVIAELAAHLSAVVDGGR
ncbi:MAG TPA: MarR family winged helix-turn-helix transcriptional regulator [Conexibacter sp.]